MSATRHPSGPAAAPAGVKRLVPATLTEWLALEKATPAPTFFAGPAWAQAFVDAYPRFSLAPVWCEFADGSRVLVPLITSRGRLGWRECVAMPLDTYTAAFESDGRLADQIRARSAFAHVLAHMGHRCVLTPWPVAYSAIALPATASVSRETSLLDVSGGAEAALARMGGNARRMANQAARRGVTCAREAADQRNIDAFYAMLSATAAGWERGTPTYPKRLLEAVVTRGGASVELWFARFESTPIAGGVVLFGADELMFWSAAMSAEHATLRASNALNVALIRTAAERGVRWYNLGSSEGLPGLKRFKEGLGAGSTRYAKFVRISRAFAAYRGLRVLIGARGKSR